MLFFTRLSSGRRHLDSGQPVEPVRHLLPQAAIGTLAAAPDAAETPLAIDVARNDAAHAIVGQMHRTVDMYALALQVGVESPRRDGARRARVL